MFLSSEIYYYVCCVLRFPFMFQFSIVYLLIPTWFTFYNIAYVCKQCIVVRMCTYILCNITTHRQLQLKQCLCSEFCFYRKQIEATKSQEEHTHARISLCDMWCRVGKNAKVMQFKTFCMVGASARVWFHSVLHIKTGSYCLPSKLKTCANLPRSQKKKKQIWR